MFLRLPACVIACVSLCLAGTGRAQNQVDELRRQGVALSQRNDFAGAIAALQKASQLAPRDYEINLLLGVDLIRAGRPKEALEPLRIAAEVNPQDASPAVYLGQTFAGIGDFSHAADAFEEAVRRSPKSPAPWIIRADFDLERFRLLDLELRTTQRGVAAALRSHAEIIPAGSRNREELLERSALAGPEQRGIWGELGSEQLQLGLRSQAAAALKTAEERQPKDLWTLRFEAQMAAAQGDWREAETALLEMGSRSPAFLRKTLQSWPRNLIPAQRSASGEVWNCVRKSSTDCLKKIAVSSDDAASLDDLFAQERWEGVAALAPPPAEDVQAWFERGVAQAELDDCTHAIPALERSLGTGAERAAFWLERCYVWEANQSADHIAALGDQVAVHRLRGDMLVRINGDPESATKEYLEAIRLNPRDGGLVERLAQAYFAAGDLKEAQVSGEKVLGLDPNRPMTLHLLASIAIKERNYGAALTYLHKLLALTPRDPWARIHLGMAYAQTGKPQEAVQYLQSTLAAGYPDERGALHALLAGALRKLGRDHEAQRAAVEAERLADRFEQGAQTSSNDDE